MASFLNTQGGPQNRQPDKEIAGHLFRPVKGLGKDIAIDDLKEDDHGHDGNKKDEDHSLPFGQDVIDLRQRTKERNSSFFSHILSAMGLSDGIAVGLAFAITAWMS